MIEFVKSPIYDNWFKKYIPEKKLLICTPYMKQGALDRILELYNLEERSSEIEIQVLIRGTTQEFTINKSSDISILDSFLGMKNFDIDNVKRVRNLHMKAYLVDDKYLLITSGNLTNNGMFVFSGQENFEGGIATDDENTIKQFKEYFQDIWMQGECLEEFYEKLLEEYTEYISHEYSDRETIKRIRRPAYRFEQKTVVDNADAETETNFFDLDDLPPVGNIEYIEDTLELLNENKEGLTYIELGMKLRGLLYPEVVVRERAEQAKTNNTKFGEEKGKFLVYFGLAVKVNEKPICFKISNLGKMYLEFSDEDRMKYLKDQILSKPAIREIFRKSDEPSFHLAEYLKRIYQKKESTLARKKGSIISLIKQMYPEEELKEILERLRWGCRTK